MNGKEGDSGWKDPRQKGFPPCFCVPESRCAGRGFRAADRSGVVRAEAPGLVRYLSVRAFRSFSKARFFFSFTVA